MKLEIEDVADELQLDLVFGRRHDSPDAVDTVRVGVRVVGRLDEGRRSVGRQPDDTATVHHHLGVDETKPGRRLTVGVRRELDRQIPAGRRA